MGKVDDKVGRTTMGGAFQVRTTPQSIKIDCYGTEGKLWIH
jgi:hypothetical protein